MKLPLVSVVCLCYNHARFVKEAIESVLHQTYKNIEVIVVDDHSQDASVSIIQALTHPYPQIKFIPLNQNLGNCKAFNWGYKSSSGDFVIDFATDDVMMPDRIERQVHFFQNQHDKVGVVFTDAIYINEMGVFLRTHYEHLIRKGLIKNIPEGDVFRDVLTRYFICSPTMMVKRKVMDALQGYDETLAYEDFDFWVRASRYFYFAFLNTKTTKVRKTTGSLSTGLYQKGNGQLHSTFLVCQKAEKLCRDGLDKKALRWRVLYEFKQAVFSENKTESKLFANLLRQLGKITPSFFLIRLASWLPVPWSWFRKSYYRIRYH